MTALALKVYQISATLLLPFITCALVVRSFKQREYRQYIGQRLGFCPKKIPAGGIIIHGSSLGEITALKPFIELSLKELPEYSITVTCFTPAGRQQIINLLGGRVNYAYLPIDSPPCNALFLHRLKPKAIVFMETEIWPSLIAQAHKRGIQQILINARLSERSVKNYQKISALITPTLKKLNGIYPQSDDDKKRFELLGANNYSCQTLGNLKYDLKLNTALLPAISVIKKQLEGRCVWVIGSSHEDEEDMLLDIAAHLVHANPHLLVVIAPRHKERFKCLAEKLDAHGLAWVSRGAHTVPTKLTKIWLIDTLGELLTFYGAADICTVAGSFGHAGGHNPVEPALFKKCITFGPNMQNAQSLATGLLIANAARQDSNTEELALTIQRLIKNTEERCALGQNAGQFLSSNSGATEKNIMKLKALLAD
ncbi:MAG: 3-deoxy-D-manno-octulosonic acid transferase [Marinagarivorans sp.]|nr:3-deoxy-D-manno-octulosonic acid transferase [Marinagarivorans sp.]